MLTGAGGRDKSATTHIRYRPRPQWPILTRMHLENRTVSRKTPGDGRLEISGGAADRLRGALPDEFPLLVNGEPGRGRVERMPCTCRKAAGAHEHWFLSGERLRALVPERIVGVALEENGVAVADASG